MVLPKGDSARARSGFDVNPLGVAGEFGELRNQVLGNGEPGADAGFASNQRLEFLEAVYGQSARFYHSGLGPIANRPQLTICPTKA